MRDQSCFADKEVWARLTERNGLLRMWLHVIAGFAPDQPIRSHQLLGQKRTLGAAGKLFGKLLCSSKENYCVVKLVGPHALKHTTKRQDLGRSTAALQFKLRCTLRNNS
jgi:hypothetical protein